MSFLGQRFVSVCETISVANYLLHRLIKQSNSLFFGCVFFFKITTATPQTEPTCQAVMSDYSCHPIWASASVWNEGLFRDTNHHFGHFIFVPHAFIRANVSFSLKWSQIDLDGQFRLLYSDLQWHCRVFGVCCAGVLPAKQITQHDLSLLYSAELLFVVVVVVCFYFFCWSWNGDICCTACYMHATLQIFPHLLPDMQAKVSKCLGLWKWNAEARSFCFHSYFSQVEVKDETIETMKQNLKEICHFFQILRTKSIF